MSRRIVVFSHSIAVILLGAWGILEVGSVGGTLSLAFWFAWFLYAAALALMSSGSKLGAWIVFAPPLLWASFSGSDIVPQILATVSGKRVSTQALIGALLVTLPCGASVVIHFWYAAVACRRWGVNS